MQADCTLRFGPKILWSVATVAIWFASLSRSSAGEHASDPARFAAQLAAGEFAPALEVALAVEDPITRDAWLSDLSAAQAAAGGREQAFRTLLSVSDDRVRAKAIKRTQSEVHGSGGGTQADFDSLIDLIVATVRPQSWDEVGGPGSISEFRNGVYVDPSGVLRRVTQPERPQGLAAARLAALDRQVQQTTGLIGLRKVSLPRLEAHVQLTLAAGRKPDDAMRNLAGLQRIQYVFVYPESGDIVLAGPAGPWRYDDQGRAVSVHSARPVLQLEDLVVLLRHSQLSRQCDFGCSIDPTQEGLARTRAVASRTQGTPLKPGQRAAWIRQLREAMGLQNVMITGIDPQSRVARVIVDADYHMKLIGMGLTPGVAGVPSYLDLIRTEGRPAPTALDVLRWWFTMNYDAVSTSATHDAFQIHGQGVQVLSENELLTQLGERVHTGGATLTNQQFASNFTAHFAELAQKYPVYADLQNVFDLALVVSLVRQEGLADRVGWHLTCFGDPGACPLASHRVPRQVETVINHRRVAGKYLVVGVSGGVQANPAKFVERNALRADGQGALKAQRLSYAPPPDLAIESWWWD